ncbi:MAG: septum formation initiator family protein [Chthoniobacteraceae bacterium]
MSTHDFSEFRERRQTTVWHTLNKLVVILILLAGSVTAVLYFLPEVRYLRDMKSRRDTLQTEKETKSAEVKKNHRVEELLKNDPEYVETIARDKLDLMKPGETIIRMDTPSPAPAPVASGSESD